ncbi:MAG: hypothetical protein AB7G06_08920 [Bdellovibrionales bacterium]
MMNTSRAAKLWITGFLTATGVFIAANFFIWFYGINLLFIPYPNCGDLARMAFAPHISQCRTEALTLPKRLHEWKLGDTTKFEILSFGDSISRGRGGGTDNYWQDFVATRSGKRISWVSEMTDNNYPQDIMLLRNSGFLKKYGVKYVVVQAAERGAVPRLSADADWDKKVPLAELEKNVDRLRGSLYTDYRHIDAWEGQKAARFENHPGLLWRSMLLQFVFMHGTPIIVWFDSLGAALLNFQGYPDSTNPTYNSLLEKLGLPQGTFFYRPPWFISDLTATYPALREKSWDTRSAFMSDGARTSMAAAINNNFKWLLRRISDTFGIVQYDTAAEHKMLNRKVFSGPYGDELLFHKGDYKSNRKNADPKRIQKMHDNLNRLADVLAKDGIKLYFMPSPNKLTVYEDYLAEPLDTQSTFFEAVRALPGKKYTFIDTEKVIRRMVESGEKDVSISSMIRTGRTRHCRKSPSCSSSISLQAAPGTQLSPIYGLKPYRKRTNSC